MAVHNGSIVVSIIPLSCLLGLHAGTVLHAEGPFFFKDIFLAFCCVCVSVCVCVLAYVCTCVLTCLCVWVDGVF
uniref:Uncharacterized protein n=1 Tax=Amphiprion percula TaxID=161767 RepID=A0A3P8RZY7_AMPPE